MYVIVKAKGMLIKYCYLRPQWYGFYKLKSLTMFMEEHKNALDLMAEVQFYWQEIQSLVFKKSEARVWP